MTHQPETLALLRDTEHYLSALHGSVARHDNLAANYGCAGCELRDRIAAAVSAAVAPPTNRAALRDRIAEAMRTAPSDDVRPDWTAPGGPLKITARINDLADAVLAVLPSAADRAAARAQAFDEAADMLAKLDPVKAALAGEHAWKDAAGLVRHMARQARRVADETATRSDVGTEFARQADQPDEAGLAAWEGSLTDETATETPSMRIARTSVEAMAATAQHAPGKAIRCPDCRAKGYTVCQDEPAATTVPCSSTLGTPHQPHNWEPQPGMDPVHCPGTRKPPMDPVHILGIEADEQPAAGARQDGAES